MDRRRWAFGERDVLRGMRADEDGLPRLGESGRYLGARPDLPEQAQDGDIPMSADGLVQPETGGTSVSPPPVTNLALHRGPPEYGGRGKDPVLVLDADELPPELRYRPYPEAPERHGFVEPSRTMSFEEYLRAIQGTRALWRQLRREKPSARS